MVTSAAPCFRVAACPRYLSSLHLPSVLDRTGTATGPRRSPPTCIALHCRQLASVNQFLLLLFVLLHQRLLASAMLALEKSEICMYTCMKCGRTCIYTHTHLHKPIPPEQGCNFFIGRNSTIFVMVIPNQLYLGQIVEGL